MKPTQDDIELLEGFLINHFRYASDFFDGVNSARAELAVDADYENTMKVVFERVLFTSHEDTGKLMKILRQSANWFVTSDESAQRKLAAIYEETLATVNFPDITIYADLEKVTLAQQPTLSCRYPTQYTQQEKWLAVDIINHDIKTVADSLETHYCELVSVSKTAFMTQVGVSFGIAVLSGVFACMPAQHSQKQSLQHAISRLLKHHKNHDLYRVFEIALDIMAGLPEAENTMAAIDISIVLRYACQLLDAEEKHSSSLYDWFDVIFEGEALSNDVISFAQTMYQWIVLDVLPNASGQQLPTYMLVFDRFYPTHSFLHKLASTDA